jgi:hypothetical protein
VNTSDKKALLLILVLSACRSPADAIAVSSSAATTCSGTYCFETADPLGPSEDCPGDRWVGVLPGELDSCPPPAAPWQGGQLFAGSVELELASYCLYYWTGDLDDLDLSALPHAGLPHPEDWLDVDCHYIVPFSHPFEQYEAAALVHASAAAQSAAQRSDDAGADESGRRRFFGESPVPHDR